MARLFHTDWDGAKELTKSDYESNVTANEWQRREQATGMVLTSLML